MRSVIPVAILVLTSFALAGCANGDGDEDDLHYVCSNGTEIHSEDHPEVNATKAQDLARFCPGGSTTTGSRTNTTSAAPNVPPVLDVKITDAGGNVTSVTMLDGNLTFDASNSTDSDGTIAGIAVTITDSNTTRTATLYDAAKKQFKTATFTFDRPGVVNVTIAMVDDRAGFTVNQTHVYVNTMTVSTVQSIALVGPPAGIDECYGGDDNGPVTGDIYEAQFFKTFPFGLEPGATLVEASSEQDVELTICKPIPGATGAQKHEPVSETDNPVVSNAPLPPPTGTESYHVGATANTPNQQAIVTVIVHYEPQEAAAAE